MQIHILEFVDVQTFIAQNNLNTRDGCILLQACLQQLQFIVVTLSLWCIARALSLIMRMHGVYCSVYVGASDWQLQFPN